MAADDLATQGARASAVMVLAKFIRNVIVAAPERLTTAVSLKHLSNNSYTGHSSDLGMNYFRKCHIAVSAVYTVKPLV